MRTRRTSLVRATERCVCSWPSEALKALETKRSTQMETNQVTESNVADQSGKSVSRSTPAVAKPKGKQAVAPTSNSHAGLRARAPRSARGKSLDGKLACRYCGSDDLAPSFKKRRDARCRACFKKRYGTGKAGRRTARTNRKSKAAKQSRASH
jgi:hypothetical protein